ncbi:MAG TPA: hypothetical protein VFN35_11910, partial [Ktedonobacteraceae bacterium]|nr:hypothetical protein [Ktedonobacteraceae bacterium]
MTDFHHPTSRLTANIHTFHQETLKLENVLSIREEDISLDQSVQKESAYEKCCLHQLFEEQVQRTPHALALVMDEHYLSYSQLNRSANLLAHQLRSKGV